MYVYTNTRGSIDVNVCMYERKSNYDAQTKCHLWEQYKRKHRSSVSLCMFYAVNMGMSLPDQQSMTGCKAEARQRKSNLITATYPQAEGLQVQSARRESELEKERESGIITAQTRYSDSTTLAAPIKIALRAITGYRL